VITQVLVLNGPNLGRPGVREPEVRLRGKLDRAVIVLVGFMGADVATDDRRPGTVSDDILARLYRAERAVVRAPARPEA